MSPEQGAESPGPWRTDGSYIVDARGFAIAGVTTMPILPDYVAKLGITHWALRPGESYIDLEDMEAEANARLMAAAPELLEAAMGSLGYLEDFTGPCDEDCECTIHPLRAAIARATETEVAS